VRIVTWNVNSLAARLPRVLELLAAQRPDVVLLQETKSAPERFPLAQLHDAGYGAVHHSAGRWAGVALLARAGLKLEDPCCGLPGEPAAQEARWCEATVGGIRFASVYVPNGRAPDSPEFERKLRFLEAIADRAQALRGSPLIIAGDMNVAPEDRDVYDPAAFAGATHVTEAERGRLREIMRRGQLLDAYRHLHPEQVHFTWWDYRAGHFHRGLGMRIDLALVACELAAGLVGCGIERDYRKGPRPSDHAPLLLALA